jgi:hypothetical protein
MKFGILSYGVWETHNIGDTIQSLGLRNAYKKIGIKDEDIVYIERDTLSRYNGIEYIILPMAAPFSYSDEHPDTFPVSDKIIPIWFGTQCFDYNLDALEALCRGDIVGCRDEYTMQRLRKDGIEAYISGCISLQFGEVREKKEYNKIFLVDIPDSVKPYIPEQWKDREEAVTHIHRFEAKSIEERREKQFRYAQKQLNRYRDEAALVITSRFHCAIPCISMGIPTIVVKEDTACDPRYGGMDKLFHVYKPDEFDNIDWNVIPPDVREIQEIQREFLGSLLEEKTKKYRAICSLSEYFENRENVTYFSPVILGYLTRKQILAYQKGEVPQKLFLEYVFERKLYETHIVIYGAGDKGLWMYDQYKDEIELCCSIIYVDSDSEKWGKTLNGKRILSPKILDKYPLDKTVIIIAMNNSYTKGAQEIAKKLTREYGLKEGVNYYMLDKLNKSAVMAVNDVGIVKSWNRDKIWSR